MLAVAFVRTVPARHVQVKEHSHQGNREREREWKLRKVKATGALRGLTYRHSECLRSRLFSPSSLAGCRSCRTLSSAGTRMICSVMCASWRLLLLPPY